MSRIRKSSKSSSRVPDEAQGEASATESPVGEAPEKAEATVQAEPMNDAPAACVVDPTAPGATKGVTAVSQERSCPRWPCRFGRMRAADNSGGAEGGEKGVVAVSDKYQIAQKTVKKYMYWSMGAGLVPVPILDLVAVSGVQLKMLAALSKVYGIRFQKSSGKAAIGSLVGFIVPNTLSYFAFSSVAKTFPGLGSVAGATTMVLFSGACAWALGNVFIQHFESGGTFLDFDPDAVREYFRAQFEEGQRMAATMKPGEKAEA
jgi:uncharacterized protein (DUF697 family)